MSETAENPEKIKVVSMDEYKRTHPEYIQAHVQAAVGESVGSVQSPRDPEHKPIIQIADYLPNPEDVLGKEIDKVEGVTESTKSGFSGWWDGFFRGRPRVSDNPIDFQKEKDRLAAQHGQIKKAG